MKHAMVAMGRLPHVNCSAGIGSRAKEVVSFSRFALFQSHVQGLDQKLIIEWLPHECQSAGRQCLVAYGRVLVRGDEDDGKTMTGPRQLFLHLQTVKTRHLHIKDDTVDGSRHCFHKLDKLLPGVKHLCVHPYGADKTFQSSTDRFIVIDNGDQWFVFRNNPLTQHRAGNKTTITLLRLWCGNSSEGRDACILDLGPMAGGNRRKLRTRI